MRRLLGWVATILVLACWWSFRPTWLGGETSFLIVAGHSMDGTYRTGDFVVVRDRPSYEVGDIVGFTVPEGEPGAGMVVIHRISGIDADGRIETLGDNNPEPDPWRITVGDVEGEAVVRLPGAGTAVYALRHPATLALVAGGLATWAALGTSRRDEAATSSAG